MHTYSCVYEFEHHKYSVMVRTRPNLNADFKGTDTSRTYVYADVCVFSCAVLKAAFFARSRLTSKNHSQT